MSERPAGSPEPTNDAEASPHPADIFAGEVIEVIRDSHPRCLVPGCDGVD
jgi:hypothetical protein